MTQVKTFVKTQCITNSPGGTKYLIEDFC